tara:strand:- start:443 stop:1549 length:1107 start_codon:yes stop_codon:yes gene_type:complete
MNLLPKFPDSIKHAISTLITCVIFVTASASGEVTHTAHIVSDMPANSWLEIPNSHLASVGADPEKYPNLQGYMGVDGIIAYSGGVYDSKRDRLVVWGGGHADYQGNEIYAFDVFSLKWERLTEPSEPNLCEQVNSDGTPNSRHTYNGIAYIEHADRMFGTGGALACNPGGCGADKTWTFDFDLLQWTDMQPKQTPRTDCENVSAYDPESGKVWLFDVTGLWSYHFDKNKWKQHNNAYLSSRTAVVDTKRGLLVVVGQGEVTAYDVRDGNYRKKVWETSGAEALINETSPGLAYDPVSDRIVGWAGGSVFSLNPDTRTWVEHKASGGPNAESLNDVYGLWRYVPSLNAFIVMPGTKKNIFFYKLTDDEA